MNVLSFDSIEHIARFLDLDDLYQLAHTNRSYYEVLMPKFNERIKVLEQMNFYDKIEYLEKNGYKSPLILCIILNCVFGNEDGDSLLSTAFKNEGHIKLGYFPVKILKHILEKGIEYEGTALYFVNFVHNVYFSIYYDYDVEHYIFRMINLARYYGANSVLEFLRNELPENIQFVENIDDIPEYQEDLL